MVTKGPAEILFSRQGNSLLFSLEESNFTITHAMHLVVFIVA